MMQILLQKDEVDSHELLSLLQARAEGEVDFLLVDVREDSEYSQEHIRGVDRSRPTTALGEWQSELLGEAVDKTVIFTCRTGNRSGKIQNLFAKNGHKNTINHAGGIVSFAGATEK